MKRAFRETYNRELALLKERATEFAAEYPGLADRLGGLLEENLDPTVGGLLEGSAFLAARVQTKINEEFQTFTRELLEQVFPDALAPTPSVVLMQAKVPYGNSDISQGLLHFKPGEYMDARFLDAEKRVSCRFALAAPLTLWPVSLDGLSYHAGAGPIGALGQEIASGTKAGIVLDLDRIGASGTPEDAETFTDLAMDDLSFHLIGPMPDAVALYEQLLCDTTRVSLRWLDPQGDPVFATLPKHCLEQSGFAPDERLFSHNKRLFDGFALLREFFVFPRKFLGMRLRGLNPYLKHIRTNRVQVIIEFNKVHRGLASRLEAAHLALHTAPAVNLFEEMSSQVRLTTKMHENVVTPNSTPITHYEVHAIKDVWAHYVGHQSKVRVHPLYALPPDGQDSRQVLYYTYRRKPRRLTAQERRFGASKYRYKGTETFISIYAPPDDEPVQRLQVNTLCSNRHLPEYLPIAQSRDDFFFCEDQTVTLSCVAGPTPPRDSLADLENGAAHRASSGDVYWRLVSYLSLNHFGLNSRDGTEAAATLREMLSLFADLSENVSAAQVSGLHKVETRPVARTVAHVDGFHTARGLEVTLTFDEDEYEGSGVILIGAVLDRFLSEYAAVNSFTQTVIQSHQRGHIKTFPPRSGSGQTL